MASPTNDWIELVEGDSTTAASSSSSSGWVPLEDVSSTTTDSTSFSTTEIVNNNDDFTDLETLRELQTATARRAAEAEARLAAVESKLAEKATEAEVAVGTARALQGLVQILRDEVDSLRSQLTEAECGFRLPHVAAGVSVGCRQVQRAAFRAEQKQLRHDLRQGRRGGGHYHQPSGRKAKKKKPLRQPRLVCSKISSVKRVNR